MRPAQWIKNLSLFASLILNDQLFNLPLVSNSVYAFIVFSLLSSSAYLVNDVLDINKDKIHPNKKFRPIAHGDININTALFVSFLLSTISLILAISISRQFFITSLIFILLQFTYSLVLKKKALFDILGISFFFIIRVYAGELATGYHLPVWLMLTVIFLSLFIASGKRRGKWLVVGIKQDQHYMVIAKHCLISILRFLLLQLLLLMLCLLF